MLSKAEKKQYHRHLILDQIGSMGQQKLKQSKVLVIGAGGLGCPVLQYLTAAGIGTIGIVDGDSVDISNLQRQILFTTADIGKNKVEVAKSKLSLLNPHIQFEVFPYFLNRENALSILENFDYVVDGSDNFPTRYLVNDACVLANKPLIFGSIFKFQGQVAVFNYEGSATYRCLYPMPPPDGSVPNCSDIGVLGVLPGIIGSLQANEVLKLILDIGEPLVNKLLYFDTLTLQQQVLTFQKNPNIAINKLEESYELFCGVESTDSTNSEDTILAKDLDTYLSTHNLLDVRSYREYEEENIGGLHIPLDELEERLVELKEEKKLVVACATGNRSKTAVALLQEQLKDIEFVHVGDGLDAYFTLL